MFLLLFMKMPPNKPTLWFMINTFVLKVWDLRQNKLIYNMQGHGDSVTGLSLSSEGSYLLSNSMDNTGKGSF